MSNTISGMMKVFYNNFLIDYTNTITSLSGSTSLANLTDLDRTTRWLSQGSSDLVTEYINIVFNTAQTINRLVLLNMNWKNFHIMYWDGSSWLDFQNVYTLSTTPAGAVYGTAVYGTDVYSEAVADSANADSSRYFEFDTVSTTTIRIEINTTIVANAEKYLYELYIGAEIGTFVQDLTSAPCSVQAVRSDTNATYVKKSNGGEIKYERSDKWAAKFALKQVLNTADQTIVNTMFDQGQFAILPCGAVPYTQRGMRLIDFYHVVIEGNEESVFAIGRVANMGLNYNFALREQ